MHTCFIRMLALALAAAALAQAAERSAVTSIKPLLLAAIEHGEAHGKLTGEAANFMRERFKSTDAIEIDVRTLAILDEPGCKRLEVSTRQERVAEAPNQPATPRTLVYQVSYCRDGRFPATK